MWSCFEQKRFVFARACVYGAMKMKCIEERCIDPHRITHFANEERC